MVNTSIKVEDLDIYLPSSEVNNSKVIMNKSYTHSKLSYHNKVSKTYQCFLANDVTLRQLEEMTRNPYFASVPISGLESRLTTGFIDNYQRNWIHGVSTVDLSITQGYVKFLFLIQ